MKEISNIASAYSVHQANAIDDNLIISESFSKTIRFGFFLDDSAQIPQRIIIPYELISTYFLITHIAKMGICPSNKAQYRELGF